MLWKADTSLIFTERLLQWISIQLAESSLESPIPALLLAIDPKTRNTWWEIVYYERKVVDGKDFDGLLLRVSELEVVFPQGSWVTKLEGMQLDWDGSRYVMTPCR